MATTNEWYQRSVRDYEDKVRDFSADLAFIDEQIKTANASIADLRRRRFNAADDEEVELLTDQINNVTSRRNGFELRRTDTQQALTQAQNSLAQAQADLARVNQGAPAQTQPLQPPSAPAADPASRQAQAPVTRENNQVVTANRATDVTDPGEVPGVTVSNRLQTDPGEVPGQTVFGDSFAADTGGVPTQQLRNTPAPVPAPVIDDDIEGGAVGFPEGTFAGDGYGFVYDEDGELVPADSAEADRIRSTPANTAVDFAGDGYGFDYDEDGELIPSDSADAARIRGEAVPQLDPYEVDGFGAGDLTDEEIQAQDNPVLEPEPPLSNLSVVFEEDLGGWIVIDDTTGNVVADGFDTQAQAEQELARLTGASLGTPSQADVRRVDNRIDAEAQAAADTKAKLQAAQEQFTLQQRFNQTTQGDWRVIIRLAPSANYLYKDSVNTLLQPLRDSDGVVFPYTPTITTNYVARYDPYELTHANYRGFFYKNSHVGEIQINGVFTAQDSAEASYLLAVIHFFRSCTKMFYGQDPEYRGSPPPMVELSGYGEFQFNNHPCVVSNFNYTLPNGVDYIRVGTNNQGLSLANRRNPISASTVSLDSVINRLTNAGLPSGAEPARADLGSVTSVVNGTAQTSYVPTKMEIQLTLLPIQTREQISKGFRLDEFARGNLLRGGFW